MRLNRALLQAAVDNGLLRAEQLEPLWRYLQKADADRPGFRATHLLYYFGGLLAIGAMSLFMTLGWEMYGGWAILALACVYGAAGLAATEFLLRRGLRIPAGIMAAFVLVLVPLGIYGLQSALGYWQVSDAYRDYHRYIDWRWLLMELGTLAGAVVLLLRYRLPFLVMPVAVTLWYMGMDLAPLLLQNADADWQARKWISVGWGLLTLLLAFRVDLRSRRGGDFSFWLYLAGAMSFWGGLSAMQSDSELGKFIYLCINLAMLPVGVLLSRRVFVIFGALGVTGYLGHLAYEVFEDSLLFPLVLSLIGFAIIWLGILWQRNEERIAARLRSLLPESLRELVERKAE